MKKAISYLLIFMGIQIIGGATVPLIWRLVTGNSDQTAGLLITVATVSAVLSIVVFLALRYTLVSPNWLRTQPWTVLTWSVIAALGALIPSAWIQEQIPEMPNLMEQEFQSILSSPWGYVAIGLLAPLSEEMVMRGGVLRMLLGWSSEPYEEAERVNKHLRPWTAIALSALFFALIHFNPVQMPHAFIIGLLLGWMYWRTGSILPGVAYHWANNSAAFVFSAFYPNPDIKLIDVFKGSEMHVYMAVAFSLLILLPSLYQLHLWMRRVER